jgi:carbonic anhydrase
MGAVARRGTHFQLHGRPRKSNGRHFVNALKFVNRMDASLESTVAADETFSRLKEGNNRHASGNLQHPRQTTERRRELAETQHPFAIILSCSDSRVPPEIIFDQGLGDLFVCRLAANVINDESLGSIEYAVEHLGVRLIVVLGHQRCGAVQAARDTIPAKGHIQSLVMAIKPAVEATAKDDLEATIKANVKHVVNALRSSMPILKPKIDSGGLKVIGGYYSLDTGFVSFLDEQ